MADDKTLQELRAIHEEVHRLREEQAQARREEIERLQRIERNQPGRGAGTMASESVREATKDFL
ncbi:hypothetical protein ACPCUV_36340 [Streptomyces platensis]|uniref:hypothetical protein n=1 Tax=Streptomyces platensis TaxID=58346 RepID=UPI003C2D9975